VGGTCPQLCFPPPMPSLPTKNTGMLLRFCLSITPAPVAVAAELSIQTAPLQLCLDLGIGCQASGSREAPAEHGDTHPPDSADTPATSRKVSSFIYDKKRGIYPLQWEDLSSFHAWRREEELAHSVELIAFSTVSEGRLWLQKRIFVWACLGKITGLATCTGHRYGLPRVRVRVGIFPPARNPYLRGRLRGFARVFFFVTKSHCPPPPLLSTLSVKKKCQC
jgi:hypothetical protein